MPPGPGKLRFIVLVMAAAAGALARASEPFAVPEMHFQIRPKAKNTSDHAGEVVQRAPDFWLMDGGKRLTPSRMGLVYHIERAQGDQLLLSMPGQGLHGWVPAGAVVPYYQAESFFTNEIRTKPRHAFAFLMRAIVCPDNAHYDRTFADLDEVIRLDPRNLEAWIQRAFLWQCRNRLDLALADVNKAIQIDPRCGDALAERAMFRYCLKEPAEALNDLEQAIRLGSRSVYIFVIRGMILLERGQLDGASAEFRRALRVDPKRADAYQALGYVHLFRSEPDQAIPSFDRAIQLEPNMAAAYDGRANAFLVLGEYRKSLNDLNKAIELEPMNPLLIRNRGALYAYIEEWDQSLADATMAIRMDPNDAEAHRGRAWILANCPEARLRDGTRAVASATRACELTQWKAPPPLATLAAAYAEAGDFPQAVRWQQKAIAITPQGDPARQEYLGCLDRYRAGKPCHRLGLLEEIGLRKYQPASNPAHRTRG